MLSLPAIIREVPQSPSRRTRIGCAADALAQRPLDAADATSPDSHQHPARPRLFDALRRGDPLSGRQRQQTTGFFRVTLGHPRAPCLPHDSWSSPVMAASWRSYPRSPNSLLAPSGKRNLQLLWWCLRQECYVKCHRCTNFAERVRLRRRSTGSANPPRMRRVFSIGSLRAIGV